jgi:2-polyprenyl-3-methyl-5-hydroxy-6-metoxy-1,4-benzoquinol methylase
MTGGSMKVHHDLSHVNRYLTKYSNIGLESFESQFQITLRRIRKFKEIGPGTKVLEVGTGIGWFTLLCNKNQVSCQGLEICPQFVEYAKNLAGEYNIEASITLGNIAEANIGNSKFDVIVANSTFEHVERWQIGMKKVHDALKPGGFSISIRQIGLAYGQENTVSHFTVGSPIRGGTVSGSFLMEKMS